MATIDDTWLIMPVYNEGPVISEVVADALRTFPHIVCVDDGSSDDSAKLALQAGAVLIKHPVNLGQGAAIQTGIRFVVEQTDATYAATFDSDGQHDPDDVRGMVALARSEDLAVVFGSRFLGEATPVGWAKKAVLRFAAMATRFRTGMALTDAHNGLRLLRRDMLEKVQLRHNGMAHATEIVGQVGRSGLSWREYPVHIRYTDYSRAKGQSLWNSINILIELVMD